MKKNKNTKSDLKAKAAFVRHLEGNGFTNVMAVKAPSDIVAMKDGVKWYFEIKMTKKTDVYFGAATFTEWEQAFITPETYRFIIAIETSGEEDEFDFIELTPSQLMEYSTIPPCKVYFNINLQNIKNTDCKKGRNRKSKAIKLTEKSFRVIQDAFKSLRSLQTGCNSHS